LLVEPARLLVWVHGKQEHTFEHSLEC